MLLSLSHSLMWRMHSMPSPWLFEYIFNSTSPVVNCSNFYWTLPSDSSVYYVSIFCPETVIIAQVVERCCVLGRKAVKCGTLDSCKILYSLRCSGSNISINHIDQSFYITQKLANRKYFVCANSENVSGNCHIHFYMFRRVWLCA